MLPRNNFPPAAYTDYKTKVIRYYSMIKNIFLQEKQKKDTTLFQRIISHPINTGYFKTNKYLYRSIYDLCGRMNNKIKTKLLSQDNIIFIPVTKIYACSVSPNSKDAIIFIFPDLLKKLSCVDNSQGLSILAHEIGHLYHQHARRGTPELKAQIEADDFAYKLGLGTDLCDVLSQFKDIDSRTRISYLTSKILSEENT